MDFKTPHSNPDLKPAGTQYGPFDPHYYYLYSPGTGLAKDMYGLPNEDAYSPQGELGLDLMFDQKRQILSSRIEMLVTEIGQRRSLRDCNLYRINLDQCSFQDMILLRGDHIWDKYRFKLEQDILGLEQEKRREYQTYFRDLLFLKKELREAMIEGLEENQKAAMFGGSLSAMPQDGEPSRPDSGNHTLTFDPISNNQPEVIQ